MVLRVRSENGAATWGTVIIDYTFLPEAQPQPSLYWSPSYVESGVAPGDSVTETVTLSNRGFAPMVNVSIAVVQTNGDPAPAWVLLNAAGNVGNLAANAQKAVSITFNPGTNVALSVAAPYTFYLRVSAENHVTRDIPFYVWVNAAGAGNVLIKASDIYTGTLDGNNQIIQGLAGARIKLVKEEGFPLETNLVTDALGEALFLNLPAGRYSLRATADGHFTGTDRIWVKPGVTTSQPIALRNELVTVEWSVRETTIQDKYEIVLTATYKTYVPAAVVVIEPKSVTLPDMQAGDVFNGEFTMKNYGLIRAEKVTLTLPTSDQYFKYEMMAAVPATLEAQQVVRVPYRVTCLKPLEGSDAGGGGGCSSYGTCFQLWYTYKCSNGSIFEGYDDFCTTKTVGQCSGGVVGTSANNTSSVTWSGGGGSSGGTAYGGGGSYTAPYSSIPGVHCGAKIYCDPRDKDFKCCQEKARWTVRHQ